MKKNFLFLAIVGLAFGCGSGSEVGSGFDRQTMLTMYADEFIVAAFKELNIKTTALNSAVQKLTFQLNTANLSSAKTAWKEAYTAWQSCNGFNFGPASDQFGQLDQNIGIYPVNVGKVESYINAGDTSLKNFDRDSRGFLGVEYLLFGADEAKTLTLMSTMRAAYLRAISSDIAKRVFDVSQKWDSYRSEFISSTGTDGGSSASLLYNDFVGNFEAIKNFKVGVPLGKRSGQTKPEPQRVEAYYSGLSTDMMRKNFAAVIALYNGKNNTGWKTYLENVVGGKELVASTTIQINAVQQALDALPDDVSFSSLCETEDSRAVLLHTELQKLTRFFKSDMSSLLGIAITYQSGDGD